MMRLSALVFPVLLAACDPVPDTSQDLQNLHDDCLQTGGTYTTSRCCVDRGNYPETCSEVPCDQDCAEEDLFTAEACDCGADACWDGEHCLQLQ